MKLMDLLRDVRVLESNADMGMEITQVVYDSRKATAGCLFVAISGFAADGNRFIPMALEKGAAAVVTAKNRQGMCPIFWWSRTVWLWRRSAPISTVIPLKA